MKDIDRLISQALATEAESFLPNDLAAAEQRFLRGRRKRRFTWFGGVTLATAAAIVAVAVFPRPELVKDERVPVAGPVTTSIAVGEAPVSVSSTRNAVWVANSGDGTVSRIDPDTKEVIATIEVGGSAEEVVSDGSAAWVYDAESRTVREIDPSSNEIAGEYSNEWPEGTHLDLALKDITLWMADPVTQTVYFDYRAGPAPDDPTYVGPRDLAKSGVMPERGGDVALESGSGEVWAYNGRAGSLTILEVSDGVIERSPEPEVTDVLTSENGDLAVGGEALWVSDDFGVIMRVDRKTYKKQYIDLGGRHSDLSYGGGYLWALTTEDEEGAATLRRIDPTSGDVVGDPIPLKDEPVDVSADEDAVWVAHKAGNSVTRIDVTTGEKAEEPEPSDSADELANPLGPDDLVMVLSGSGRRGGMTYRMYGDGRTELLTSPIEADLYPSFVASLYSDNPAIIVERRDLETLDSDLKYVDVATGEITELVPGSLPAVSPNDQLAYWRMEKENPTLFITEIGTDFERRIQLDSLPAALAWDAGGRFVYIQTADNVEGEERPRLLSYDSKDELGWSELNPGDGALYLAPSSRDDDSVHLIRIETDSDGAVDSVGLVEIPSVSGDPDASREVVDLSELGIDEQAFMPENLRLKATGNLDVTREEDGSLRWGLGGERSWILGFRTEAWLVKESGEIVALGELANGGVAIAPEILLP